VRLRRGGWAVTRFDTPAAAVRRLHAQSRGASDPALVLALEGEGVSPAAIRTLRETMPQGTIGWYGVTPGSPTAPRDVGEHGFELRTWPFSPAELARLVEEVSVEGGRGA